MPINIGVAFGILSVDPLGGGLLETNKENCNCLGVHLDDWIPAILLARPTDHRIDISADASDHCADLQLMEAGRDEKFEGFIPIQDFNGLGEDFVGIKGVEVFGGLGGGLIGHIL